MILNASCPIRGRVRASARISESEGLSHIEFQAMGTHCKISLIEPSRKASNAFLDAALNWAGDFEAKYSRFQDSSLISKINAAAGVRWVDIDPETEFLFNLCGEMNFLTRGVFEASSLPLLKLWNWKTLASHWPSAESVSQALQLIGWSKVQRKPGAVFLPVQGMGIDLGGIGKEYAVDRVTEMAKDFDVENVMVDFGRDIRALGQPPRRPAWHIGLENPESPGQCWGSVALSGNAIASSGDSQRHCVIDGRRYSHIIDPRSGWPVQNDCRSVTAVAAHCTLAGILTTTAFILGPKEGIRWLETQFGASGVILTPQHKLISPRFHEHLVPTP